MFPGLTEWFQNCSFSRRGSSTQILIWGLITKIGTLAFLSLLILMFSVSFFTAPSLHPDVWSNQTCRYLFKALLFGALFCHCLLLLLLFLWLFFYFLSLPGFLLFFICFSLNFPFSKGFTDHSCPFLTLFNPQMVGADTTVLWLNWLCLNQMSKIKCTLAHHLKMPVDYS